MTLHILKAASFQEGDHRVPQTLEKICEGLSTLNANYCIWHSCY